VVPRPTGELAALPSDLLAGFEGGPRKGEGGKVGERTSMEEEEWGKGVLSLSC